MEAIVDTILDNYKNAKRDSLIPILQEVQDAEGFLSESSVVKVGKHLDIPTSTIFGVATFYNQFRLNPPGKHTIKLCAGTACHVKGTPKLLSALEAELEIKAGETTRDGMFSVETVYCLGACSIAPVAEIDGTFYGNLEPKDILKIVNDIRKQDKES